MAVMVVAIMAVVYDRHCRTIPSPVSGWVLIPFVALHTGAG